MSEADRWRLPDGVDELLPAATRRADLLGRRFIDLGIAWGFEPVTPPLIEYLDGLLTGTGTAMDLQTFKLVDQQDGRALGVRADMTPQVARIDAHAQRRSGPNRLHYTGTVLRARTDAVGGSRNPQQFGAELFGHAGPQSDLEMCRLMLETVLLSGLDASELVLSLGHIGVYAGLASAARLPAAYERELFDTMVRGSVPDMRRLILDMPAGADPAALSAIGSLPAMRGGTEVLDRAARSIGDLDTRASTAIERLRFLIDGIRASHPIVRLHIDLADLRGYRYHTGALFAAHDTRGVQLARGGRYDAIGEAFGSPRPATGFSGELHRLAEQLESSTNDPDPILLRDPDASGAFAAASECRAAGDCVVSALPDCEDDPRSRRELVCIEGDWTVRPIRRV